MDVSSSDLTESSGYESSRTGFGLGTSFEQYEDIYLAPSFSAVFEDVEVESTASSRIKKMEGNYFNLDFNYGIIVDKRNQPFQPSSGYRAKFSQSLPIIIDSSSLGNKFEYSAYHTLSEDVIGSVKFLAQTINGLEGEDTRLSSRLFIPQNRLRICSPCS